MGFQTALGEVTLVLFTSLAPGGILACVLMLVEAFRARGDETRRLRIDRRIVVPSVAAMAGLVASSTHLGNPGNALYVLAGLGRSPLSNEVAGCVAFLAFAGTYWLYSFVLRPRPAVRGALALGATACGVLALWGICAAYSVATIPTWDTWYGPVSTALNAGVGGAVLAATCLSLPSPPAGGGPSAGAGDPSVGSAGGGNPSVGGALSSVGGLIGRGRLAGVLAFGAACLAANVAVYALQGAGLAGVSNSLATFSQLVPGYRWMLAVYALLCAAGIGLLARDVLPRGGGAGAKRSRAARATLPCVLVFVGVFVMRFAFYMGHMTVGLGV